MCAVLCLFPRTEVWRGLIFLTAVRPAGREAAVFCEVALPHAWPFIHFGFFGQTSVSFTPPFCGIRACTQLTATHGADSKTSAVNQKGNMKPEPCSRPLSVLTQDKSFDRNAARLVRCCRAPSKVFEMYKRKGTKCF